MLKRIIQPQLEKVLNQQKISLILGARRTGKTELLKAIFGERMISRKLIW